MPALLIVVGGIMMSMQGLWTHVHVVHACIA
jgi:hypothetical protein